MENRKIAIGSIHAWTRLKTRLFYVILLGFAITCTPAPFKALTAVAATGGDSAGRAETGQNARFHLSPESAFSAAQQDQCPVMFVFRADWDVFSRTFSRQTLHGEDFLNNTPCIHIALLNVDEHAAAAADYQATFLPHLTLLTAEGKIIAEHSGILASEELLDWIRNGLRNAQLGLWHGLASSGSLARFLEKFDNGTDSEQDRNKLVQMLGDRHPSNRSLAADMIQSKPKLFLPDLIEASNHPRLALRVGVCDLLHKLFPDSPIPDPWDEPQKRDRNSALLRQWWAAGKNDLIQPDKDTLRTREITGGRDGQGATPGSIRKAVQAVLASEGIERTRALAYLIDAGPSALPDVRRGIEQAEGNGNPRAAALLEETRWSILTNPDVIKAIPDAHERLMKDSGQEWQALTRTLGDVGEPALDILAEFMREPDPLLQESVGHALAKIRSKRAITILSGLLASQNPNLRMVGAQLLGKTKKREAGQYLPAILQDANEVVATTAIAALIELEYADARKELETCLSDSRWRIRAAAAHAIGELELAAAAQAVTRLLQDPDPYVVKTALATLDELNIVLPDDKLKDVAFRQPQLIRQVIAQLLKHQSPKAPEVIAEVYDRSDHSTQKTILAAMADEKQPNPKEEAAKAWHRFFQGVMNTRDADILSIALEAVQSVNLDMSAAYIEQGLTSDIPDFRQSACRAMLRLLCYHHGDPGQPKGTDHHILAFRHADPDDPASYPKEMELKDREKVAQKAERAKQIEEFHQKWFRLLASPKKQPVLLEEALGLAILGEAEAYLASVASKLTPRIFSKTSREKSCIPFALDLTLSRLKWPSARPFLEKALQNRTAYLAFFSHADKADPALIAFLKQPDYFCRHISAEPSDLQQLALEKALGAGSPVSLYAGGGDARKTIRALMASREPLQCTLGTWVSAHDATLALQDISARLTHPDPWVRRAAVVSVIQRIPKPQKRSAQLLRLAGDPSEDVLFAVVAGLLPDRLRQAESISIEIEVFKYETIRIVPERQYFLYTQQMSTRPFRYLADRPAWLKRFQEPAPGSMRHGDKLADLNALLHAVYGDFALLSERLKQSQKSPEAKLTPIQLLAIAHCRDDRYVAMLEKMVMTDPDGAELESILKATRHWSGEGVRGLRRLINRLFRKMG